MKKALKYISWFFLSLIGLVLVYIIFAVALSYLPNEGKLISCSNRQNVYVSTNGVHLYLILPAEQVVNEIINKMDLPSEYNYFSFGWGDKQFYTTTPEWKDLSLRVAFNALFLNSEAAIHVTVYQRPYKDWRRIEVCPEQVEQLNDYIYSYFEAAPKDFIRIYDAKGYSEDDYFYEAKGSYSFYLTSNEWVNRALKSSEITTSVWSPFDFGVLHHVDD